MRVVPELLGFGGKGKEGDVWMSNVFCTKKAVGSAGPEVVLLFGDHGLSECRVSNAMCA